MRILWVLAFVSLTGCASPSFVGRWSADDLTGTQRDVVLSIQKDGTFVETEQSGAGRASILAGTWRRQSESSALLFQSDGGGRAEARLVDSKRMTVSPAGKNTITTYQRLP